MMKRAHKRLFALLLTAIMALSLVPALAFAQENTRAQSGGQARHMATGYIPVEIPGTRAVSDAYARGDMETYYRLTGQTATRDALPSHYDSRDYGYVTSVKDQNPWGSCWAHAAMGSVEGYMIKHGIPVGNGPAATTDLDLSETQHCFFTYDAAYDAEGMLTGDNSNRPDGTHLDGGNGEVSTYTLMRWTGAADESATALQYSNADFVEYNGLTSEYAYHYNVCHVQNAVWVPGADVEAVKRAIMEFGAGEISYYEDDDYNPYICTIGGTSSNHAITVIGWDDSIDPSLFTPNTPTNPGAWICKNSWGEDIMDDGYCYISYEDTTMNSQTIEFFDAEPIGNYDHNYQYDGSANFINYSSFANNSKFANIFTAKGDETLRAIALCTWDEATTYTVDIYKNPTAGNPSSGTLMTTQTGDVAFTGYYTIRLDNPVSLHYGDTFAVVITLKTPVPASDGTYVHFPYDTTNLQYASSGWSFVHADRGAVSYSKNGNSAWTICPDSGSYRIKAYTDDGFLTVTAEADDEAHGTVTVYGKTIVALPAEGYSVAGYEIVSGTAEVEQTDTIFHVVPSTDCNIRVLFEGKDEAVLNYFVPDGVECPSVTGYAGETVTLPYLEDYIFTADHYCTFLGWTTEPVSERVDEMPEYIEPETTYTLNAGEQTLYALYSYCDSEEAEYGICTLIETEPENWEGDYVITYNGTKALDATGEFTGTAIGRADAALDLATLWVEKDESNLYYVPDELVFHIAPDENGTYTVKMKNAECYLAVTSNTNMLTTTTAVKDSARWNISMDDNGVVLTNVLYPGRSLQYSKSSRYFRAFANGKQEALTLYAAPEGTTWFTTDPTGKGGIPVSIITQPVAQTVVAGNTVTFSVETVGDGVTYQWWYKAPGKEWTKVKVNGTSATYTLTAQERHNGYEYRCRVYNAAGEDASSIVTLTVVTKPVITSQPVAQTVKAGEKVTFSVEATGGGLTYQWWYKAPGGEWTKVIKNGTSATYTLTTAARHNGYQYRCEITNAAGTVTSKVVKLTVLSQPAITTQPVAQTVNAGETASFSVNATGGGLSYQWWYLKPGTTEWVEVRVNGTSATYTLTTAARHNGYQYRCEITNAVGTVTSRAVKLTVK